MFNIQTISKSSSISTLSFLITLTLVSLLVWICEPALAQGGLDKVNAFADSILSVLRTASLAVVTIAIMWSGYKFLFKHADIAECGRILAGGLLIGGAAEIARYLLA